MTNYKLGKGIALRALSTMSILVALLGGTWGQAQAAQTLSQATYQEYDSLGRLIKEVIEPNSPNDCIAKTYVYDAFGNRKSESSSACAGASGSAVASAAAARTSSVTYSADGRFMISASNALGHTETREYEPKFGGVTKVTGPNGLVTTVVYDSFSRKIRENRADGTYTLWTYAQCSAVAGSCPGTVGSSSPVWLLTETSYGSDNLALGHPKIQFYDGLDRVVRVMQKDFSGADTVQDTWFDAKGQVLKRSAVYALANPASAQWYSYTYDVLGRQLTETAPDSTAPGGVVTASTLYAGNTVTVTNGKNQKKTSVKNSQGQVIKIIDDQNNEVNYSYDALGRLIQTNAAGSITTLGYSQRGFKTSMTDPAMGQWTYAYNIYGELVSQTDGLNKTSTMAYDLLGRMIKRTEPDLVSDWAYDTKFDGGACGKGLGKLCEAKSDNGYLRTHTYDTLGRAVTTTTTLGSGQAPVGVTIGYDAIKGRVASKTYPTGYKVDYSYTTYGYLSRVKGGGTTAHPKVTQYDVLAVNSQGQVTQYKYGNQITTVKDFSASTGRLMGQTATLAGYGTGNILTQTYGYDTLGNISSRADTSPGVGTSEAFTYDNLNRLRTYQIGSTAVSPPSSTEVIYDARGNIVYKSDAGYYTYDPLRANRLASVLPTQPSNWSAPNPVAIANTGTRTLQFVFDDYLPGAKAVNGNVTGNGNLMYTVNHDPINNKHTLRWEEYTSFNMIKFIKLADLINPSNPNDLSVGTPDKTLDFVYGPEHQRIKQVAVGGPKPGTVWYLNGEDSLGLTYERELKPDGTVENKHYIDAGGFTFGIYTTTTVASGAAAEATVRYLHTDHLGSAAVITDDLGHVVERLAYDPWGKRRFVSGLPDAFGNIVPLTTDRGFTMHEHLDEMGLIHMNGRVYDPYVGRFLSADPYIQDAGNLQSFNRYSYVLNNPLTLTDPSGYFSLKKLWRKIKKVVKAVVIAVVMITAMPYIIAASGSIFGAGTVAAKLGAGAMGGFLNGALSTGNLKGAFKGMLTGMLFAGAGAVGAATGEGSVAHYAAHAGTGCVSAVAQGGKCGQGALSAVVGKYATVNLSDGGDGASLQNFAATSVAGGLASVAGGGTFADGASTAAQGYLFNQMLSGKALARIATIGSDILGAHIEASGGTRIADSLYLRHDGRVSIADGVYDTGNNSIQVAEVKLGNGRFTVNQRAVYPQIDSGNVEFFGKNAPKVAEALNVKPDASGRYYLPKGTNFQVHVFSRDGTPNPTRGQVLQQSLKGGVHAKGLD